MDTNTGRFQAPSSRINKDEDGYPDALYPLVDQAKCDGCGTRHSELISVPDGTPAPLHLCAACELECRKLFWVEKRPTLREVA